MIESMSVLKSTFAKKESKLNSSAATLYGYKKTYFRFEHKISHTYIPSGVGLVNLWTIYLHF